MEKKVEVLDTFIGIQAFYGYHCAIDLGYSLSTDTIFWPGGDGFQLCMNCATVDDGVTSYDYAAGVLTCAEHGYSCLFIVLLVDNISILQWNSCRCSFSFFQKWNKGG